MNNTENRSQRLDECLRSSLKDTETFEHTIKQEIEQTVYKVNYILENQQQCINILHSRMNEGQLNVRRLEEICIELERKLSELNERFLANSEKFNSKKKEIELLGQMDFMKHLRDCEELDKVLRALKITICLFVNITKIKWDDLGNNEIKGKILKDNKAVQFDIKENSRFKAVNQLWDIIS